MRIVEIEEDADGALTITAEDFPQGAGQAPIVPPQPPSGYSTDMNVAPGNAAAPVVFEPPIGLAGQPELWLATSGGATYGGCAVWVSLDNVTYKQVGALSGKSRHGITTAALPLVSDPDTTSTLAMPKATESPTKKRIAVFAVLCVITSSRKTYECVTGSVGFHPARKAFARTTVVAFTFSGPL